MREASLSSSVISFTLLLIFLQGCSCVPCSSKEAVQCENRFHTELEYSGELSAHMFCSVMAYLKDCLKEEAKCNQSSTEEKMADIKRGLGIGCRDMGDEKTEIANGCREPEYSQCLQEGRIANSQAIKARKLAKDYACEVAHSTSECLQSRAGCNKVFVRYRVQLSEQHFGLTCAATTAAPPSAAATISAAFFLLVFPLKALALTS